ncbi:Fumarase [Gloeomargarita lithophora Alchichica-D10]|uniref:Fumarase n=1 Tax=Gloeomargarita lithophora Alchichica-D10 TaxID=1188229 RepID=A0A1J0AAM4_9CYAN|nr:ROK family protein [Gloeomargarita lithophora]APB32982.1 Fumarase [Gloeomargarita lithophora Alchichica-D10]
MTDPWALAVDLGGTHLRVAVVTPQGERLYQEQQATPRTRQDILTQMWVMLRQGQEWATQRGGRLGGIGISTGGRVDFGRGEVVDATALLPDWRRVPLRDLTVAHLGLSTWVENDGNCAALGELWFGAGQDCDHFLSVVVGTGIGGGVILNRQVLRGAGSAAGELGHISVDYQGPMCNCGNWGCVELFASGSGLANLAQTLWEAGLLQFTHKIITSAQEITAQDVGEAAQLGNPVAQDLIRRAGRILGTALTSLLHTFNPERVIVGGPVLDLGENYWQPLVATVAERAMVQAPLVRSPLRDAGLLGAATLVWQG